MFAALALLFLVVPFIELFVLIQVGQLIGALWTIALLVAVSIAGGWLVKREGINTWRRLQAQIRTGSLPGVELVDGVLILFAGALLLTPGFLSDLIGIALLVPPVRMTLRAYARKRLAKRMNVIEVQSW